MISLEQSHNPSRQLSSLEKGKPYIPFFGERNVCHSKAVLQTMCCPLCAQIVVKRAKFAKLAIFQKHEAAMYSMIRM